MEPLHHTQYVTRLSAYAVILDQQDRMLLTWYNGQGRGEPAWSLPGGGIEFDETLEEGLAREVYEEAGYRIEAGDVLHASTFTVDHDASSGRPFRGIRLLYAARITGGRLGTTEVGGSTDFARWVSRAQIRQLPDKRAHIVGHALDVADRALRSTTMD